MHFISLHSQKLRILLYIFFVVCVVWIGVVIEPDTGSYRHLTIIAPPGYSIFLFVFRKVFGEEHYLIFVVAFQLIIGLLSVWYFVKVLSKNFQIDQRLLIFLDVILLSPILIPEILTVNRVVTQGLAYPAFLCIVAFFIEWIFNKNNKKLFLFLGLTFIGTLIRAQFFFILPVVAICLFFFWYRTKNTKRYILPFLLVCTFPFLNKLTERSFNYAVHDRFVKVSSTGLQMFIMPFYVADAEDYRLFDDKKTQDYYRYIYKLAEEKKLLDDFYQQGNYTLFRHFDENYIKISYGILRQKGLPYLYPENPNSVDALIATDTLLMSMYRPLLLDNFWKCVDLFYKNVTHAFGGFYMIWFCFLMLLFSYYFYIKRGDRLSFFAAFLMALTFSNILLICVVQHSIPRYLIYHQWMLPVVLVLLFNKALTNNLDEKLEI